MAAQDGGGGLEKAHLSTQQRRRLSRLWKHCIQGLSTDLLGVTQTIRSKRARKTLCTRGTINTAHNTQHNILCNLAISCGILPGDKRGFILAYILGLKHL